jgi:hypothetical protein
MSRAVSLEVLRKDVLLASAEDLADADLMATPFGAQLNHDDGLVDALRSTAEFGWSPGRSNCAGRPRGRLAMTMPTSYSESSP